MTTTLRKGLIFDLYCTRSSALEPAHGVPNIDRITETCVGVDDQWCLNNAADGLDVERDLR